MATGWALDLGTTNTGVACWDEAQGKPRLLELPAVCRKVDAEDPLEAPRLVPSAVRRRRVPGECWGEVLLDFQVGSVRKEQDSKAIFLIAGRRGRSSRSHGHG